MGCVLGPAKNKVSDITRWFLKENGKIIPRCTMNNLAYEYLSPKNEVEKGNRDAFDNKMISILCESIDFVEMRSVVVPLMINNVIVNYERCYSP